MTEPISLDCHALNFHAELSRLGAALVIHTAGPFQGQSYSVPLACIRAHTHYVDLADGRDYVCNISELDREARANDVLVVSGASSLPALSSAVVDKLSALFSRIDGIDHGITSGARPPGTATMRGVLAYAGKPLKQWCESEWRSVYGWQDVRRHRYPSPVNARWIASCDVPDLDLFPRRYRSAHTVQFRAGVGPTSYMLGILFAAWLIRCGIISSVENFVPILHRAASSFARFGSKSSAMHVTVWGLDLAGKPASRTWFLIANQDHGPFIPTFPAIALARKILRDEVSARGAVPCMGLLSIEDILAVGGGLDLRIVEP